MSVLAKRTVRANERDGSHMRTQSSAAAYNRITVPLRVIFQMENTSVSGNKNQIDVRSYIVTLSSLVV